MVNIFDWFKKLKQEWHIATHLNLLILIIDFCSINVYCPSLDLIHTP